MNDIVDDLKTARNYFKPDLLLNDKSCFDLIGKAIQEIESLRQLLGITEDIAPIGAVARSPHWNRMRDRMIEERGECEACGCKVALEVHHIGPFHERPELELEPSNLIVLDRVCHFLLGHLRSWRSWNGDVMEDAIRLRGKVRSRP